MAFIDTLIDARELHARIDAPEVKLLDGTWVLPDDEASLASGFIPGAQVFDIDLIASPSPMAHMMPTREIFENHAGQLGLTQSDTIVVYDRHGLFSAPRVWWTFHIFGHENVTVLNGGLPAWIKAGYAVDASPGPGSSATSYEASDMKFGVVESDAVLEAYKSGAAQIIDARPLGRFLGTSPEPREGVRSGHIPGSISLPFSELKSAKGELKPGFELAKRINQAGIDLGRPIITSCGSGITAAALAYIFIRLGASNVSIYDGSWTEWGASDLPIVTRKPNDG